MLVFADDMGFLQQIKTVCKHSLIVYSYIHRNSGLEIRTNIVKNFISKKRRQDINFKWYINGTELEIVESFVYLGLKFYKNGSMKTAIKALSDQAMKAFKG